MEGGISSAPEVLDSFWVSDSSPSFPGSSTMLNFEDVGGKNDSYKQAEKKRRLLPEQVQFLEKSFDLENKLEPERKVILANELGLQPRQVAIWFQNRRARLKSKQLEKEYDCLKASFDLLKADYDALYKENERLKIEVHFLKEKFDPPKKPAVKTPTAMACKQEAASSSDVLDSNECLVEPTDSSHASDEEDNRQSSCLPKLELQYYDDLQPNSCNLGFPVQDQGTWLWQC